MVLDRNGKVPACPICRGSHRSRRTGRLGPLDCAPDRSKSNFQARIQRRFATRAAPAFWRGTFQDGHDDGHDNRLKSTQKRSFQANGTVGRFLEAPKATECRSATESGLRLPIAQDALRAPETAWREPPSLERLSPNHGTSAR